MVRDSRFHCWSNPQRLVNSRKVAPHVMKRHGIVQIIHPFIEPIRQPSEPPHTQSHREVLAFYKAGRDVLGIAAASNSDFLTPDTLSGTIACFCLAIIAVQLD